MRFFLFSFIFIVFWMPQKKGKPKKAAQKGGKQATINVPPAGANDSSPDGDNEAHRRGVMAAAFWVIQKRGGLVFVKKTLWNRRTSGRRAASGVLSFCLDLPHFTAF